jgi:TolA-binding protein
MRRSLLALPFLAAVLLIPQPAHAVSKEIIQLQTQVQELADMVQHLQTTNDERMGVLQHLVEQSADSVNRMQQQMTALQGQIEQSNKNDTLSSQIQGLNDSVDELKSRLGQVNKQLTDIQSQLQNVQAQPAPQQAPQQGVAGGEPNVTGSGQSTNPGAGFNTLPAAPPQAAPQAPPVDQLYQGAMRDYNGARYDLATSEFADVIKYYPQNALAGNSSYYLGEIAYRKGLYPAAIRYYDMVLEQFAGSSKSAAAQLRKAQAELASEQREAGIRDLRSLIQRYPSSPEGAQGRSLLNGMGVRIVPNKPSPGR